MARPQPEMIGREFHYWKVEDEAGSDKARHKLYKCRCKCGTVSVVRGAELRKGNSKSCGCYRAEFFTTHGHYSKRHRTPTYRSWMAMIARCYNTAHEAYPNYGGRGIEVHRRWRESFAAFLEDMGERPYGKTLDRKDPNGNYEPDNCQWANVWEQAANKRRKNDQSKDAEEVPF